MAYYFFHHPLDSRDGIPGRYAFDAIGMIASNRRAEPDVRIRVSVDGLSENLPGPNIDPCPFAAPLTLIHSFCRIDRRGGKYYVHGTRRVLSFEVQPGDTVLYGHLRTCRGAASALFIDTVLVVESTRALPTLESSPGCHAIQCGEQMILDLGVRPAASRAPTPWSEFVRTDVWLNNLRDSAPGGTHAHSRIAGHRVILGAGVSAAASPAAALAARTTSFVTIVEEGLGPRSLPPELLAHADRGLRDHLANWLKENPRMASRMKPPSRLPDELGYMLYDVAVAASGRGGPYPGFVAIPPLQRAR